MRTPPTERASRSSARSSATSSAGRSSSRRRRPACRGAIPGLRRGRHANPDRRRRDDHPARPAGAPRARGLRGRRRGTRRRGGRGARSRARRPTSRSSTSRCRSLDGIEAARRILDERPIPIVMVTAYGEQELVARAVEAGRLRLPRKAVPRVRPAAGDRDGARPSRGARRAARGGRLPRRGARRPEGDRAREGPADGAGGSDASRTRSPVCARRARSPGARSRSSPRRSSRPWTSPRSRIPQERNPAAADPAFGGQIPEAACFAAGASGRDQLS